MTYIAYYSTRPMLTFKDNMGRYYFLIMSFGMKQRDIVFVVEVYKRDRIEIWEAYVTSINNPRIKVRFVESSWVNDGSSKNIGTIKRFIANSLTKYH